MVHGASTYHYGYGQPPDCILCMIWQFLSLGNLSAVDEAQCWLKCVLLNESDFAQLFIRACRDLDLPTNPSVQQAKVAKAVSFGVV